MRDDGAMPERSTGPLPLATRPIHLGLGGTARALPHFTGEVEWYVDYSADVAAEGADGRLVSYHTFDTSWDSWEMHPAGEEVVLCVAGEIHLLQEIDGAVRRTTLRAGEWVVNEPRVWHTADVDAPTTCLFITPGLGTQTRGR